MSMTDTAEHFVQELEKIADPARVAEVARFFADGPDKSDVMGVSIGKIFPVAKKFAAMPLTEIEQLLDDPHYEVRMGAVAIMDFQARAKKTDAATREALFDLYLRRHNRINNWDLVDRAAPHVIGGWLADKPRDVLYELASSSDPWRRRTAIVATWFFIRAGDTEDTFRICAMLVDEQHEYVCKAIGSWLRTAGGVHNDRLISFLDQYAGRLSRVSLRMATEKLPKTTRDAFLARSLAER